MAQRGLARVEKKARRERRVLVFVDESGFYLLPGIVRTYAPRGQTPVLRYFLTRDHLAVMSGITPQGHLYTLTREQPLTSVESVIFLCHLRRRLQRDLLVCWDGSPIHRSEMVKTFLAEGGAGFVHLEAMPAYAPELNPDEGVWQHLKNVEMRNLCCNDMPHLSKELNLAVKRLRNKPSLIQSFFAEAGLDI